jgi:hypothetical protein
MYLQSGFQFSQSTLSRSILRQSTLSHSTHRSTDQSAQQIFQQIAAQPNLITANIESLLNSPPPLTIDLLTGFEQSQPQSPDLNCFSVSSIVISRIVTHSSNSSHLNNSALNCFKAASLETSADYILPIAATAVTPTYLYQDFIWKPETPSQPWNLAGVALIGLAILPGLWLSYLGLSANPLLHQKLMLLGIELLLIGFQLFCFSLALALLIETHQSFPSLSK